MRQKEGLTSRGEVALVLAKPALRQRQRDVQYERPCSSGGGGSAMDKRLGHVVTLKVA